MKRHEGTKAQRHEEGAGAAFPSCLRAFVPLCLLPLFVAAAPAAGPTTMPTAEGSDGFVYPPGIPANQTTARTTRMLGAALQRSKTVPEQAHYLHELGLTRMPEAASFVAPFLKNENPLLRAAAAEAAGYIADASLAELLPPLLKDEDPVVRRAALSALVRSARDSSEKAKWVGQMLGDSAEPVVAEALRLAQSANAADIASLLSKARPVIQARAMEALGRLGAADHAKEIVPFLKSDDIVLKAAAITALGTLHDTAQTDAIADFLKDAQPTLRRRAVRAMAQLASPQVQQRRALELVKNDPDPSVRQAACAIFAAHPLPEAVDALVKQLYSPYLPLHDAAKGALSHTVSQAMTDQIIAQAVKLLHEDNQRRKEDGSYLLGHYRSDAAVEDHLALIVKYPQGANPAVDWDLYTQATRSLGRIGAEKAGPLLIPLLKKAPVTMGQVMNSTVSSQAEAAALVTVGQLKFTKALPQVWRILNGDGTAEPEDMRSAAVWALGVLTPDEDAKTNEALIKIISNLTDNPAAARFEACKALAHRKVTRAADALKTLATTDTDPQARFAAHWAYQHLTGQTLAYTPPDLPWTAETAIVDLTER